MAAFAASVGGKVALVKAASSVQLWAPGFDLNEMIWADWNAASLPDGVLASWVDAAGGINATQSTGANQPVVSAASGGVTFTGSQSLVVPSMTDPWKNHRAFLIIIKADVAGASSSDGTLIGINGFSGSTGARAPLLGYNRTLGQVNVQWANGSNGGSILLNWPDATNFHVILSRRVAGVHYMSIDGGTETSTGTNVIMLRGSGSGVIGDNRNPGINQTLKRFMLLQNEVDADMRDRIVGYFMWAIGRQASLPGGHPYASAPPTSNPFVNPYPINTAADWNAAQTSTYWTSGAGVNPGLKSHYPNAIASLISGFTEVFREDFTSISAIASESAAAGGTATFFGPSIDATGGSAITVDPAINTPAVFSQSGSVLTITMQKSGSTWFSGSLASVNLGGLGYTPDPSKAPMLIESKVQFGTGNGVSMWGVPLWVESNLRFFNSTTPYEELDCPETYNSENSGQNDHQTQFLHMALRAYGTRNVGLPLSFGKDFALDSAHSWPSAPVSTYDGAFHLHQFYRDKTWTIVALDGFELGRWPTMPYMLQPLTIITSLNQLPAEAAAATGTYTMGIDYIRVLQGTPY